MGEPADIIDYSSNFFDNAVASCIQSSTVNEKANACPMAVRLAWHAAGTFQASDNTGGSDGATMRFEPESTDDANAGLGIMRDILQPVKDKFPHLSYADIWTRAGAMAVNFTGGPKVPFNYGRTDQADGATCPANGRLPDASQGAAHLRDVFYRMGFDDQEIVILSGAHTLGRCHKTRSGFDGPWTTNPLKFDNEYFKNLISRTWTKREWDGPEQFEDETKTLMMLPTDIALTTDDSFRPWVEKYAADEALFFADFAKAFSKLISLGCPAHCQPSSDAKVTAPADLESAGFREHAMHGSLERMKTFPNADPNSKEANSGRTALHKAAYWGHVEIIDYLCNERKVDLDVQDSNGDTALHDAARFGHTGCVKMLISSGAKSDVKNNEGMVAKQIAEKMAKVDTASIFI